MADDGRSDYQTMGTAETCGRRNGRDIRHAIRRRALRHATTIPHAVTGDRAIRHAMIILYSRMYAYVCVCMRVYLIIFSGVISCRFSHSLRRSGGAAVWWSYDVRLCPVMSGYARLCPVVPIDAW